MLIYWISIQKNKINLKSDTIINFEITPYSKNLNEIKLTTTKINAKSV